MVRSRTSNSTGAVARRRLWSLQVKSNRSNQANTREARIRTDCSRATAQELCSSNNLPSLLILCFTNHLGIGLAYQTKHHTGKTGTRVASPREALRFPFPE